MLKNLNKLNKGISAMATGMILVGGSYVQANALPSDMEKPRAEVKSVLENKEDLKNLNKLTTSENSSIKDKAKDKKTIQEPIKDGVYSIGFTVYRSGTNEESMMNNFLDKNAKLEVKNGKLTLTVLFKIYADQIYDFRMESNGQHPKSIATNCGIFNEKTKQYEYKKFQLDISDIDSNHKGYALVGAMGGLTSDIGNIKKYRDADFGFDRNSLKEWNGFEVEKKAPLDYNEELNKKLVKANLDKNKDNIVSDEELKSAEGNITINSVTAKDFKKIKLLGENVNELSIFGENVKEISKDTFNNLKNLKKLDLRVDLEKLPEGIFDNLKNLQELTLMSNNLSGLPRGIFDKLTKLKGLSLEENPLEKLNSNIFNNLKELEYLSLKSTKLKEVPKEIYNLGNLKNLNLENNNISKISKEISKLKNLEGLYLGLNYLEELPSEIYNLKNLNSFYVENNLLKEIPKNLFELLPSCKNVFYSLNKIKLEEMPKEPTGKFIMSYPQNIMNLNLTAKNGKISWNQDLSSLDVLCLRKLSFANKPKNIEEYKACLKGKTPLEFLKNSSIRPVIETKLQKKNKNGEYFTIKEILNDNESDHSDTYNDDNMKNGDEYRIVKRISVEQFGSVDFVFKDIVSAKAEIKKETENTNKKDDELNAKPENKESSNSKESTETELIEKPLANNEKDSVSNAKTDNKESENLPTENELVEKPSINTQKDTTSNVKTEGKEVKDLVEKSSTNNKKDTSSNVKTDNKELTNAKESENLPVGTELVEKPSINNKKDVISNSKEDIKSLTNIKEDISNVKSEDKEVKNSPIETELAEKSLANNYKDNLLNKTDIKEDVQSTENNENEKNINNLDSNKTINSVLPKTGSLVGTGLLVTFGSILASISLLFRRKK